MPHLDLRGDRNTLDPLAAFKVLAKMCHPNDVAGYERMLAGIRKSTGAATPRRQSLTPDEFLDQVGIIGRIGNVAGRIFLARLQLRHNGYSQHTVNSALPLVYAQLIHGQLPGYAKRNQQFGDLAAQPFVSEHKMRDAYAKLLPVVHLWAAVIYGQDNERADIWPGSPSTLPTFLAFADCFLKLGLVLREPKSSQRFALPRGKAWVFVLPESLRQHRRLLALPLVDLQKRALAGALSKKTKD